MVTTAIIRPPSANFAGGLTTAGLGPPDHARALSQHEAYSRTLASCGVEVIRLPPDPAHPDSTFVEDTAVIVGANREAGAAGLAVITRPGAPTRRDEVVAIRAELERHVGHIASIESPGTLDGGDVCVAGREVFVGVSARTNENGARQLARLLEPEGYRTTLIPLAPGTGLLHLKSGLAYLGGARLVVVEALAARPEFAGFDLERVDAPESYAANCLVVNGHALVAAGHPRFAVRLHELGFQVIALDVSEFRKMDGGLSCLSLRLGET